MAGSFPCSSLSCFQNRLERDYQETINAQRRDDTNIESHGQEEGHGYASVAEEEDQGDEWQQFESHQVEEASSVPDNFTPQHEPLSAGE